MLYLNNYRYKHTHVYVEMVDGSRGMKPLVSLGNRRDRNMSECVCASFHTAPLHPTVALNRRRLLEGEYKWTSRARNVTQRISLSVSSDVRLLRHARFTVSTRAAVWSRELLCLHGHSASVNQASFMSKLILTSGFSLCVCVCASHCSVGSVCFGSSMLLERAGLRLYDGLSLWLDM